MRLTTTHEDQPEHHVDRLFVQVGPGAGATLRQGGLGGRPDEQDPQHAQREDRRDERPVHVTQEGVP